MKKTFTTVAQLVIAGMLMVATTWAGAQEAYPNKSIRFITPFAPGGSTTAVARLIGQKLIESWGQQVFVDNRPGGNGFIGGEALKNARPDGYTLMLMSPTHVISPLLVHAPYDPIDDFAQVASVCGTEIILVLHPSVPANTLQELIALARSKPRELNYASSGSGSPTNIVAEMFKLMTGVKLQHIPYKGGGPALIDLVGGQVDLAFQIPISALPYVKGGRLKAIAISGETRMPELPQVRTFTEGGVPHFEVASWYGILAPVGTPKPIIDKISVEVAKYLRTAEFKEKLGHLGMTPMIGDAKKFEALMRSDRDKYGKVIKAADIKG